MVAGDAAVVLDDTIRINELRQLGRVVADGQKRAFRELSVHEFV